MDTSSTYVLLVFPALRIRLYKSDLPRTTATTSPSPTFTLLRELHIASTTGSIVAASLTFPPQGPQGTPATADLAPPSRLPSDDLGPLPSSPTFPGPPSRRTTSRSGGPPGVAGGGPRRASRLGPTWPDSAGDVAAVVSPRSTTGNLPRLRHVRASSVSDTAEIPIPTSPDGAV